MALDSNTKLAVNEAKAWDEALTAGVAQAKNYAGKLAIRYTYSINGQGIYAIDMETGKEGPIAAYPTPDELWAMTFAEADAWRDRFAAVPFEDKGGSHPSRYYQDIAVERVMQAIAGKHPTPAAFLPCRCLRCEASEYQSNIERNTKVVFDIITKYSILEQCRLIPNGTSQTPCAGRRARRPPISSARRKLPGGNARFCSNEAF